MRRAISFAIVALIVVAVTRAQIPSPTTGRAQATGLAPGWEEIDARLDFLTVRLASVEASLGAVKKAMKELHRDLIDNRGEFNRNLTKSIKLASAQVKAHSADIQRAMREAQNAIQNLHIECGSQMQ